jgi:hypothetical protein
VQHLPAEPEAFENARAKVLQQYVGLPDQPLEHLTPRRRLEIQRERALPAVLREERDPEPARAQLGIATEVAREIATARHLDLHHVRAHQPQLVPGERPGEHVRQVQHPYAGQQVGSRPPSTFGRRGALALRALRPAIGVLRKH